MGGAGNLACSRLFSRLFEAAHRPRKAGWKAGCSQDWLLHLAANESLQPAKKLKFSSTGFQACVVFSVSPQTEQRARRMVTLPIEPVILGVLHRFQTAA